MSYLFTLSVTSTTAPRSQLPESVRRAQELFRQFHCFPSRQTTRLPQERAIPEVLAHVGELCGLIYRSDRGAARPAAHFCPLLQTSPAAHLRCPWQTTLHPGRELPRHAPRPRGLKMLGSIERGQPASLSPSNGEDHAAAWRFRSKLRETRTDHEFQPRIRRGHDRQSV